MNLVDRDAFPALARLVSEIVSEWPDHIGYVQSSLAGRDPDLMRHSERIATMVARLSGSIDGGLTTLARDYRFLCERIILPEELYFRRHGRYRLDKFEDALKSVYSNNQFMTRYMNGLLVSDIIWANHCRGLHHYAREFLTELQPGTHLLEIGPGHGLLLHLACESPRVGSISAWDVSDASLAMSRHALDVLRTQRQVTFEARNVFESATLRSEDKERFDAIVLSEVLEHLERPEQAVRVLFDLCRPRGRVWINVPANSPAPDHLYLVRTPDQAAELVRDAGFDILDAASFPMTGATLERAIKEKLTITCVISAQKPAFTRL